MSKTSNGSRNSSERTSSGQSRPEQSRPGRGALLGLTGGIAAGKSTVAALLAELGARVISADDLARKVVEPGTPALAEIVARFGAEYIGPDGRLDRKALGEKVFAFPAARMALEAIVLPRIREAFQAELSRIRAEAPDAVVVYDAPLLIEAKAHKEVDKVIVVAVDEATQVRRLMERDGLTETGARARLKAQLPLERRLRYADEVVDGTLPPEALRARLEEILAKARAA
jgi:dephospho-CoA kinase